MSEWEVYIIQAESGNLYTGITNNLERRFEEHLKGREGARFFHLSRPEKVVFRESQPNRSEATKREIAIKKMTRQEKLDLIDRISLPKGDKNLLAECRVSTYRASGRGGQHVNVTDSAVRLTHIPTSLVVTSQKERSQHLNKRECIKKLREKVEKLNYRKPKRIATRMSRAAKGKIRAKKAIASEKKRLRRPPREDQD